MRDLQCFDPLGKLDAIETIGREVFRLNLLEWMRFRHLIYVGNDASKLLPSTGQAVPESLAVEYQTLAKSHYQSVSHLVCAYHCLEIVRKGQPNEPIAYAAYFRAQPEFYYHLGASFDGVARVAFILCTHGQQSRVKKIFSWSYSDTRKWNKGTKKFEFLAPFQELGKLVNQHSIEEIYQIRNGVTHGWQIPALIESGKAYWPEEIKTQRFLAWPYIEIAQFRKYTWKQTIEQIMEAHYANAEQFFNAAFKYLVVKISDWENANDVQIANA